MRAYILSDSDVAGVEQTLVDLDYGVRHEYPVESCSEEVYAATRRVVQAYENRIRALVEGWKEGK